MNNYQKQIIKTIDSAEQEIQIAVSWFTDEVILNHLLKNVGRINISVLLSADEINILRYKYFRALINKGANIRKLGSSSALDGNFMHSKFIIVDRKYAFGGSYNFTSNARSNFETFKKWDYSEIEQTVNDYDKWFKASVDFFSGVENAEDIVAKLQQKFLEEKRSRASIIEKIRGIDFSEEELVESWEHKNSNIPVAVKEKSQEQKLREEDFRSKAKDFSNGNVTVSPTGSLAAISNSNKVKPHSFHGGTELVKPSNKKQNHYALLGYQEYHINKTYSFLKTRIENDTLIITGEMQPTPDTDVYKVQIEYAPGIPPRVFVKSPDLIESNEIHVYR